MYYRVYMLSCPCTAAFDRSFVVQEASIRCEFGVIFYPEGNRTLFHRNFLADRLIFPVQEQNKMGTPYFMFCPVFFAR